MDNPGSMLDERAETLRQVNRGANWFFWITGLSLSNLILIAANSSLNFLIGLGITRYLSTLGSNLSYYVSWYTTPITAAAWGLLVTFGIFARKLKTWAFVTGMSFYFGDTLLLVYLEDWFSTAFHVLVLIIIYRGFNASRVYKRAISA
jgi:hypothetical protein